MNKAKIIIVEDEEDIRELLRYNLAKEGYEVIGVGTGEDGLEAAINDSPDLIVLDIMLPGIDGLDVCRKLKYSDKTSSIPIVMLSAKGEESDVVIGLELGADDYISKPFSPKVLVARIKNVLRRKQEMNKEASSGVIRVAGGIHIDIQKHAVKVAGAPVDLTATEFNLLLFLMKRPGWVFTRQQIVDELKGEYYAVTERSVDVQVVGLRKKLGESASLIETVRGVGYRFKESA